MCPLFLCFVFQYVDTEKELYERWRTIDNIRSRSNWMHRHICSLVIAGRALHSGVEAEGAKRKWTVSRLPFCSRFVGTDSDKGEKNSRQNVCRFPPFISFVYIILLAALLYVLFAPFLFCRKHNVHSNSIIHPLHNKRVVSLFCSFSLISSWELIDRAHCWDCTLLPSFYHIIIVSFSVFYFHVAPKKWEG